MRPLQFKGMPSVLLTGKMLRESDDEKRLQIEDVMETAERKGGAITVVSTGHEAGNQLSGLGGIAALLRFPLHQDSG